MKTALFLCVVVLSATLASTQTRAQADPTNSTATSAGGYIFSCPLGDGDDLATFGATVDVNIRDSSNNPIAGYPPSGFWLRDLAGRIVRCPNGSNPSAPTDVNGDTVIDGTLAIGGWTQAGLQGFLAPGPLGTPLNGPVMPFLVNSPDLVGDLISNLCDINQFAWDFVTGYEFRSDLNGDAVLTLADISKMASHLCHACDMHVEPAALPPMGNIGVFFDTGVDPPQSTLNVGLGVPFDIVVIVEGVPAASAIDVPLRFDPGIQVLATTTAPPSITDPFGGGAVLFGSTCFGAATPTELLRVTAQVLLPGPQRVCFGTPQLSCSGIPGPIHAACNFDDCGLRKFARETRATVNGDNNTAASDATVATTPECCIMACPLGDGPTLESVGCELIATLVDVDGSPVTCLNESDFELDAAPPNSARIADCVSQTPAFREFAPGVYGFTGRYAAGGHTQAGMKLKVQGNFVENTLPIRVNSPDITGDGRVNLADVGEFSIDFFSGSYFFRSDLDCSGALNLGDVAVLSIHNGHRPCDVDPID